MNENIGRLKSPYVFLIQSILKIDDRVFLFPYERTGALIEEGLMLFLLKFNKLKQRGSTTLRTVTTKSLQKQLFLLHFYSMKNHKIA